MGKYEDELELSIWGFQNYKQTSGAIRNDIPSNVKLIDLISMIQTFHRFVGIQHSKISDIRIYTFIYVLKRWNSTIKNFRYTIIYVYIRFKT